MSMSLMDAQEVTKIFDMYWFGHEGLKESPLMPSITVHKHKTSHESLKKPEVLASPSLEISSLSGELSSETSFISESSTPRSVFPQCKFDTTLLGKEAKSETPLKMVATENHKAEKIRRHRSVSSKSLSDLEFEELQGFMDLGYVFSEEDKNTSLASIIPALQKLGKDDKEQEKTMLSGRPLLSEAWNVIHHRVEQKKKLMVNCRFLALSNESDMKDNLRCWAHTVARAIKRRYNML